jgi:hypothetical protein
MAKVSSSGGWSTVNDAAYRLWMTEWFDMVVASGLVQTSDTGQLNPATITIPGVNATESGYLIFRFNDSLQSTAPLFLKFRFGRANAAANMMFGIEVGTGSDGAGTITGVKTVMAPIGTTGGSPGAGVYPSYAIHKEGFAAMAFKVNGIGSGVGQSVGSPSFVVQRTVDNTGAPTADGVLAMTSSSNTSSTNNYARCSRIRFLPTVDISAEFPGNGLAFFPGLGADSRVGLAPQIFPIWIMMPKMRPSIFTAASLRGEVSLGAQYSMTLVGSVPRNYICVTSVLGGVMNGLFGTSASDLNILWED